MLMSLRPLSSLARYGRTLVLAGVVGASLLAGSCSEISYVQRHSPNNPYKDYKTENQSNAAVLGMGTPISSREMAANATLTITGHYDLGQIMQKVAGTYNTAIRWGNGVRREQTQDIVMNKLSFDEARSYLEDTFDVQIIKEGERRLLILPSASEPRLASFSPGNNVTLSQAVRGLAEQCNFNLVINENRDQLSRIRVTANLKNVTCHDAFDALLNPHGLSLVDAGDYMTIGGLPQRQWTLNLYEPQRSEEVSVNYASDFSSSSGSDSSSGGSGSSSSGSSSGSSGSESSSTAGGSNKVTIKYDRDLWKDLNADLSELIKNNCPAQLDSNGNVNASAQSVLIPPPAGETQDPSMVAPLQQSAAANNTATADTAPATGDSGDVRCGYVRINPSVGMVQMRAPRNVLDEANDIIQRVEDVASRRLLLEARVMAVTRTRDFDQRANLKIGQSKDGVTTSGGFTGSITAALSGVLADYSAGNLGNSASTLGGISVSSKNLDAVVGLLEQYGTTYELMHPMMELMDRQRATLIDGRNEKYFVVRSNTDTSSSGSSTTSDVEERNQFLGLQFSATAQISDNPAEPHTISLQIPITSLAKTVNIPSGVSGTIAGVAPIANTRLIDQKVRIRDGEIKVIGGLTKTIAVDTEAGVPLLRDIPALGKLANEEGITYENVEFVILLQVRRLY